MRVQLPDGEKINLDTDISLEDKLMKTEDLIEEWIDAIQMGRGKNNNVNMFLESLANYIVWHKELEEKGCEDKEILSARKVEELQSKRKRRDIPFSSLSARQRELLFGDTRGDNDA